MILESYNNGYSTLNLQDNDLENTTYKYYDIYVIKNENKEVITHFPVGTEKRYAKKLYDLVKDTMEVAK